MMDTVFKALNFATRAHAGQTRRKTAPDLPYIVHPVAVAFLVQKSGGSPEVMAAGLLHDVIEDCNVKKEQIEKEFGSEVARMVDDVTEQDTSLPWEDRKRLAAEHIKNMKHDSQLIKAADITHNLSSVLKAYKEKGLKVFEKFNAPLPKQVDMNKRRVGELEKSWPDNPLLPELKELVNNLAKIS